MILLVFFIGVSVAFGTAPTPWTCDTVKNRTSVDGFDVMLSQEECVYKFLMEQDFKRTNSQQSLRERPPPEGTLNITVDEVVVQHVELSRGSTFQFNIYGDVYMYWKDSRLQWDEDQFGVSMLAFRDVNKVWKPGMVDHAECTDPSLCSFTYDFIEVTSDGSVFASSRFRYPAFCMVDFKEYPEEENKCCIFFTAFQWNKNVTFIVAADAKSRPNRPLVMQESYARDRDISRSNQDHTAWLITDQTTSVSKLGTDWLTALQICLRAKKKMSTLAMALRLPVTIATLIMLVSPLFGDLRTQSFVKLVTLCLQTVCFLYLCSIAPINGFAGQKPKLYRFYEAVFCITTLSMLITMATIALSRAKRTVPPSHRVYLAAKLVNRAVCCIEPENSATYQRYIEDHENQTPSSEPNYTQDWRHIYLAVNNLFSGVFFSSFLFLMFLDLF